ncbi:MAG: rRNA pseudouridine synthase [Tepidanaerobacter acetatoxydans]|jgi:23S rRNA pseudouridine2605 synthase|uniref:pseudouridine synthase n=1 Tax=Tepidanaerobacter TaxID=499228 RepID=UPI003454B04E|nr:rRNA pseudouridine synthase [Tepidanaerobacter acetatoxydans]
MDLKGVLFLQIRLQKYLSQAGVDSRRACEDMILQGKVSVNGKIIKKLGTKVNPETDIIKVNGKVCSIKYDFVYILMNKPKGILTTVKDPLGRPTVLDLLPEFRERVFPVGRLDKETEGLLILTNDGEVTYKLTHPKYKVIKTYVAHVKGIVGNNKIKALERGIILEDGVTAPAKANILKVLRNSTVIKLEIHEGRKRQVRRMCDSIGHPVIELKRTQIGDISIKGLKPGEWRYLNQGEINYVKGL